MSDTSKSRFFQIHLSTAILLTFVAGGLLWANVPMSQELIDIGFGDGEHLVSYRGWPCCIYGHIEVIEVTNSPWNVKHLLINVGIAVAILISTAFLCEFSMRNPRPTLRPHILTIASLVIAVGMLTWMNDQRGTLPDLTLGRPLMVFGWPRYFYQEQRWFYSNLIWDFLLCTTIILAVAVVCECFIRRGEARKP